MPRRPCLGIDGNYCGILVESPRRRCVDCESRRNKARDAIRGNSSQRGLGAGHRAQVRALTEAFIAEHGHPPTHCPECGNPYSRGKYALSGQHSTARAHDKGSLADEICCVSCNSRSGARIRRLP